MNSEFPIEKAIINLITSYKSRITKRMRPLGLYPGQDMILLELLKKDGISQNKLVVELCVDHSTIAKSVNRMLKTDLVKTKKSTKDKRVTLVSLTEHGREIANHVQDVWLEAEYDATNDLSEAEQKAFIETLEKITRSLNSK